MSSYIYNKIFKCKILLSLQKNDKEAADKPVIINVVWKHRFEDSKKLKQMCVPNVKSHPSNKMCVPVGGIRKLYLQPSIHYSLMQILNLCIEGIKSMEMKVILNPAKLNWEHSIKKYLISYQTKQ